MKHALSRARDDVAKELSFRAHAHAPGHAHAPMQCGDSQIETAKSREKTGKVRVRIVGARMLNLRVHFIKHALWNEICRNACAKPQSGMIFAEIHERD